MLHTLFNAFAVPAKLKSIITTGAVLACVAVVPTAAFARHHDFHIDEVIPIPRIIVPCVPPTPVQVWVPAVYQAVNEKVWIPDVTTTQMQRVQIPAQYGYQDMVKVDFFGRRHIHREQVQISPAYVEVRPVTVVVTTGHFEIQTHQQLISEGYWVTRG